jgi:hypothetical protein
MLEVEVQEDLFLLEEVEAEEQMSPYQVVEVEVEAP